MNNSHKTNIKLIEAVEKFPELWDCSNEKYANKLHTEKVWNEIGKELDTTGANCRVRWGTIRGNFSRALKPTSSGSVWKIKKEYYLSPHLKFILPFMKSRPSSGNISQCQLEFVHSDPHEIDQNSNGGYMYLDGNFTQQENNSTPNALIVNETSIKKYNDSFDDYVSDENHKQIATDFEQANLNFFKSLLPEMARLDPKTSNEFKMSIMGQLNALLYGTEPSTTSPRIANNASTGYGVYDGHYSNQSVYHM